jgi:hypothetical protein
VITCVVEYVIDPAKIEDFERFGRRWIELVNLHGGTHHGYFLPAEGASDKALALFSFPSLAAYEQYRALFGVDPDFIEADRIRDESGCVLRYERTFMRPVLPELLKVRRCREHVAGLPGDADAVEGQVPAQAAGADVQDSLSALRDDLDLGLDDPVRSGPDEDGVWISVVRPLNG